LAISPTGRSSWTTARSPKIPIGPGKAADDKKNEINVAPEILKHYVGVWDARVPPHLEEPVLIEITLEGTN
jgi:hypothetical protein